MRALRQFVTNIRILSKAKRNRLDLVKALARRPQLALGTAAMEIGVATSARVEPRLKILAELKAASIVACEYCLDIGSALARGEGLTEEQLRALPRHRDSDAFDDEERTVLDLADALTRVPAIVDDDLRGRVDRHFTPTQQTELSHSSPGRTSGRGSIRASGSGRAGSATASSASCPRRSAEPPVASWAT